VEAEIFDFIGLNIIDFNWWADRTPCSEGDVGRLGFIDFHPPSFEPLISKCSTNKHISTATIVCNNNGNPKAMNTIMA
jgi:hypothetical protein